MGSFISKLLQTDAFTYSVAGLAAIHRAIFEGVFKHAGRFRDYDISKKEWVLRGDSVLYGRWQDLRMAIEYGIEMEPINPPEEWKDTISTPTSPPHKFGTSL